MYLGADFWEFVLEDPAVSAPRCHQASMREKDRQGERETARERERERVYTHTNAHKQTHTHTHTHTSGAEASAINNGVVATASYVVRPRNLRCPHGFFTGVTGVPVCVRASARNTHTHTHTHTCVCIYIHTYIYV
jgi:hypothetical protein